MKLGTSGRWVGTGSWCHRLTTSMTRIVRCGADTIPLLERNFSQYMGSVLTEFRVGSIQAERNGIYHDGKVLSISTPGGNLTCWSQFWTFLDLLKNLEPKK